eukprot:CAMPEP_0198314330 /NCGR_PEP_ID=MMETSP1450-20131203/5007_1 /TAXON_ID=753684 ORGANISM="Madagascaria erythrocladiodes, Strain CCMP3234" /NCGR_SAMPLE_ID=MMETSP1450 /ASSEMBLY_ACC=CAM_ASM_001115 /LENGTH=68 /DNA_ID=CAMNT_0044017373 /DNA_START=41 /DNA_END=247 /DNA_ORIENTATION=-
MSSRGTRFVDFLHRAFVGTIFVGCVGLTVVTGKISYDIYRRSKERKQLAAAAAVVVDGDDGGARSDER